MPMPCYSTPGVDFTSNDHAAADSFPGHMLVSLLGRMNSLHGHETGYRSAEPPHIAGREGVQHALTCWAGWPKVKPDCC